MLAQLLSLADSAGVRAALHLRFPDGPAARLVGADGVQEFPVAVIALGGGAPALTATGPKTSGSLDDDGIELPLVTAAQHAGDVDGLGPPVDRGAPVPAPAGGATLDDVIEQRGSIRRLHRDRAVPRDFLETSMAVAMRGVDVPHWVVVHAAGGLAPGLYRWPDLSAPLHTDVSRDDTYRIALEQGLASEAAFVAVLRARPRSCA